MEYAQINLKHYFQVYLLSIECLENLDVSILHPIDDDLACVIVPRLSSDIQHISRDCGRGHGVT
jgi:hypothetical protein